MDAGGLDSSDVGDVLCLRTANFIATFATIGFSGKKLNIAAFQLGFVSLTSEFSKTEILIHLIPIPVQSNSII